MARKRERGSSGGRREPPPPTEKEWENLTLRATDVARRLMRGVRESPVLARNRLAGELREVIAAAEARLGAKHRAAWRRLVVEAGIGRVERGRESLEVLGNPFRHMVTVGEGQEARTEWAEDLDEQQKAEQNAAVTRWMNAEAAALAQWAIDHLHEIDGHVALAAMHAERFMFGATVPATREAYMQAGVHDFQANAAREANKKKRETWPTFQVALDKYRTENPSHCAEAARDAAAKECGVSRRTIERRTKWTK